MGVESSNAILIVASNSSVELYSVKLLWTHDITPLPFHCTYTSLLEKNNVRGVPLIERFLLSYWLVLYKALLEKTNIRGAPLNERFILNGIFLTEPYTRTVQ